MSKKITKTPIKTLTQKEYYLRAIELKDSIPTPKTQTSNTNSGLTVGTVARVGVQSFLGVHVILTDVTEEDVYTSLVPFNEVDAHIKDWILNSYARGNRRQTYLNEFQFDDYRHDGRLQVFLPTESKDLIDYFVKKIVSSTPKEYD